MCWRYTRPFRQWPHPRKHTQTCSTLWVIFLVLAVKCSRILLWIFLSFFVLYATKKKHRFVNLQWQQQMRVAWPRAHTAAMCRLQWQSINICVYYGNERSEWAIWCESSLILCSVWTPRILRCTLNISYRTITNQHQYQRKKWEKDRERERQWKKDVSAFETNNKRTPGMHKILLHRYRWMHVT